MAVEFKITRIIDGQEQYSASFNEEQLGLVYDALNDYPQFNDDEDDNPTSQIMNKLYNLLEY